MSWCGAGLRRSEFVGKFTAVIQGVRRDFSHFPKVKNSITKGIKHG